MLPGGDSGGEPSLHFTSSKLARKGGSATLIVTVESSTESCRWKVCVRIAFAGSCEWTVWSQQECSPVPMSHLPAIFLQQAISGSVICRKSAAQAMAGNSVQTNRTAAASQRAEVLVTL